MTVFSNIKSKWQVETEKTRNMSLRQKMEYFLFYYRFWLIGLLMICVVGAYSYDAVYQGSREILLQGFFTNDDYGLFNASTIAGDYSEGLSLTSKQRIVFDDVLYIDLDGEASDYTAASNGKIVAYMATEELDFVVTSRAVFEHYAAMVPMDDFTSLLPNDLLEKLPNALVYAAGADGRSTACGLDMTGSRFVRDCGYDEAEGYYVMFVPHLAPHKEQTTSFIRYSFE